MSEFEKWWNNGVSDWFRELSSQITKDKLQAAFAAGQSASSARIAELESELDFQNQCRDGYRSERDMLKKDLEFAYKRAKVLADICKIPVHESPEVTGTILGLVRSHVERLESDCKAMAEAIMSDSVIRLVQLGDLNKAAEYEAKLASSLHHSG